MTKKNKRTKNNFPKKINIWNSSQLKIAKRKATSYFATRLNEEAPNTNEYRLCYKVCVLPFLSSISLSLSWLISGIMINLVQGRADSMDRAPANHRQRYSPFSDRK